MLLAQATSAGGIEPWAQFGLAGLVIFTLFVALFFLFRMHKEERKEWREDFVSLSEKHTTTVEAITTKYDESLKETNNTFVQMHKDTLERLHGNGKDTRHG